MAGTAQQTFNQAEDALRAGRYAEALTGYMQAVAAVPSFWRARFRIGDALLSSKAKTRALEVYKDCAWYAMKAGLPLEALLAIKMASFIDPAFHDGIEILADLYSAESDRVAEGAEPKPPKLDTQVGPPERMTGEALLAHAEKVATDFSMLGEGAAAVPPIPLFSFLDEASFGVVLASLQLRRFVKGQVIVQEGKPGDSFFTIVSGTVGVTRQLPNEQGVMRAVQLARLHHGAVFGEMALISNAPRTATVTAEEDCDVLELKRAALEEHAHRMKSVTRALHDFTNERLLTNLLATSPIFKPFPKSVRAEIIKKFKDFPVDAGDELIEEGEQGQGLFMIMKGEVEVSKKGDDGHRVRLAMLKEGDVFGEIALLQDSPTTATCKAATAGQLLLLPKGDFKATITRHPELKAGLSKLTAERIQKTKSMMAPEELMVVEDDDLVLL